MIRRSSSFLLPLILFLAIAQVARAATEYEVKAAFLYNFTRFVSWPETGNSTRAPVVIGILGHNPFGDALETAIRGKTVDNRPLTIRYSRELRDLTDAHVIFITRSESDQIPQILAAFRGRPVLTVAETPHFTSQGGMVRFYLQDRRVAFEINPAAAEEAGLRISSRLLNVSTIYREDQPRAR